MPEPTPIGLSPHCVLTDLFSHFNLETSRRLSVDEGARLLGVAIERKDRYTGGHTKRVMHYSLRIAAEIADFAIADLELLKLAALLHDVGKLGIEDAILKKPSALNPEEMLTMQAHPHIGSDILLRLAPWVEGLQAVIEGVKFHHERWDGRGYPEGLCGDEIPLFSRIIAVADTYDAMVSTRPYRKGLNARIAFDEILRHRGSQFDPQVVDAFSFAFVPESTARRAVIMQSV